SAPCRGDDSPRFELGRAVGRPCGPAGRRRCATPGHSRRGPDWPGVGRGLRSPACRRSPPRHRYAGGLSGPQDGPRRGGTPVRLTLGRGGARAGKSTWAEQLAGHLGGDHGVCYLATADPGDEEMRTRIAAHKAARPAGWRTIEVRRKLGDALDILNIETV